MSAAAAGGWDCHVHVFDAAAPALPGHYLPPTRTLAMLAAAAVGLADRFVLVQPSVYGSDNTVLLQALRGSGGRHRGVAVVDPAIGAGELDALHEAGVRGLRFNLVSPVGNSDADGLDRLAPLLRERGWHVQWYARPQQLAQIALLQERHGFTPVLDHLGGLTPALLADGPHWEALQRLAAAGGWIKLSGWYRLQSAAPYRDIEAVLRKAAALFPGRSVWGSDWPHTAFLGPDAKEAPPAYAATWRPVPAALGEAQAGEILQANPARLYAAND
ncbi:amidohydrolase family protein [Caenimonas terrae]|uniref:Amidohydrolase family protein n=1 Tax=Caenimonas terrae TaxID=696074 RepID=A0ABW0NL67_9BURK